MDKIKISCNCFVFADLRIKRLPLLWQCKYMIMMIA